MSSESNKNFGKQPVDWHSFPSDRCCFFQSEIGASSVSLGRGGIEGGAREEVKSASSVGRKGKEKGEPFYRGRCFFSWKGKERGKAFYRGRCFFSWKGKERGESLLPFIIGLVLL